MAEARDPLGQTSITMTERAGERAGGRGDSGRCVTIRSRPPAGGRAKDGVTA
ncbi:hypothetical protein RZS08_16705 [Arthrospira platensis SPKY1]|nr:hypothetical protein [Arthrospira platensis SPKY1]